LTLPIVCLLKTSTLPTSCSATALALTLKLSDKNAANQLDLYGLVEFGRDTTAKLKLLPSDGMLENEKWRFQEQVRIRLLRWQNPGIGF
jgi:hypothetical protein